MKRFLTSAPFAALLLISLFQPGCKQAPGANLYPWGKPPEPIVAPNPYPIPAPAPAPIPDPSLPATSETMLPTQEASVPATGEASTSTDEWGATTGETAVATTESEVSTAETVDVTREYVYTRRPTILFDAPTLKSNKVEKLTNGTTLLLDPETPATNEWLMVSTSTNKGYVYGVNTCPNQYCMVLKRAGIVELFAQSRQMRVPQIQIQINNIFSKPIGTLRIMARFYYHNNLIGEDESFVTAETLGIPPLLPGQARTIFLRPYYEMPKAETLSPENPVSAYLYCGQAGFNYIPCGRFDIVQMAY